MGRAWLQPRQGPGWSLCPGVGPCRAEPPGKEHQPCAGSHGWDTRHCS